MTLRGDDGRRQGAADGHQPRARPELRHGVRHATTSTTSGTLQHCWTTSWGTTTRMVGGLIMCHGDDDGLRVPPSVAHVQVVVAGRAGRRRRGRRGRAGSRPSCRRRACGRALDDQTRDGLRPAGDRLGAQGRAGAGRGRARGTWRRASSRSCGATRRGKATVPAAGVAARRGATLLERRSRRSCWPRPTAFRDARTADRDDRRGGRRGRRRPASPASRGRRSATRARTGSPSRASRSAACSAPTAPCPTILEGAPRGGWSGPRRGYLSGGRPGGRAGARVVRLDVLLDHRG